MQKITSTVFKKTISKRVGVTQIEFKRQVNKEDKWVVRIN